MIWDRLRAKLHRRPPEHGVGAPGERIYAIGDVHGRYDLLVQLLLRIAADQNARHPRVSTLVILGDIIDRGPESAQVVQRLRPWSAATDRFIVLKGNHEALMSRALAGDVQAFLAWLKLGGDATLRSWGVDPDRPTGSLNDMLQDARRAVGVDTLQWLAGLPLTYSSGGLLFVHAGVRPGVALERQTEADLLGIRREFIDSEVMHPLRVVHGHTIVPRADFRPNRISIDTGAYASGRLTAVGLEDDRCWEISTLDT